jgi:hypothetical protein
VKKTVQIYLIVIHVVIVIGLLYPEKMVRKLISTGLVSWNVVMNSHYRRMLMFHRRIDVDVPDNAVIFLGDSLTQGLAVDAVAPLAIKL